MGEEEPAAAADAQEEPPAVSPETAPDPAEPTAASEEETVTATQDEAAAAPASAEAAAPPVAVEEAGPPTSAEEAAPSDPQEEGASPAPSPATPTIAEEAAPASQEEASPAPAQEVSLVPTSPATASPTSAQEASPPPMQEAPAAAASEAAGPVASTESPAAAAEDIVAPPPAAPETPSSTPAKEASSPKLAQTAPPSKLAKAASSSKLAKTAPAGFGALEAAPPRVVSHEELQATFERLSKTTRSTEPPKPRFLQTEQAYNRTHKGQPSFSMYGRNEQDLNRGRVHTELRDCGKIDVLRAKPPTWTMKSRWKDDKPQGSWVPAPGEYRNPTTLSKSHPTLPCAGKGWTWGGTERVTLAVGGMSPGPAAYRGDNKDSAMNKEPSWPLLGRWKDPGKFQKHPPLQNTGGMKVKGGVARTPHWAMTSRPESTMIPRNTGKQPGPGAHTPEYGGIGARRAPVAGLKRSPSYGFGSSARWQKPPDCAHVL